MCCVAIITLFQKGYENDFFFVCRPKNDKLIPYKGPECVSHALSVYVWSSARHESRESLIRPIQRKLARTHFSIFMILGPSCAVSA